MKTTLVLATAMLLVASRARAQDTPKIGLTMGYPSAVGVLWQIGDRVAVRPELSLSHVGDEASSLDVAGATQPTTDQSTVVGAGVSALFYFGARDSLRTYVSPRFSYARTAASAASGTSTSDTTISLYQVTGSFGAQYTLGRRFGVFGEIGAGYSRTNTALSSVVTITTGSVSNGVLTQVVRTQSLSSAAHSNAVATRSGVGVIIFF